MVTYKSLAEAKQTGAAYLHASGIQASDGTLRYRAKILLIETGGAERPIVPGKNMTLDELKARVETEAKKRGVPYAVMDLSDLVIGTVSMGVPHN